MNTKGKMPGLVECVNHHLYNYNKYGNTCPNCDAILEEKTKTEEEYEKELRLSPDKRTCGYLTCIYGVNEGRTYLIHEGKNFIGSNPNMDIFIKGDLNIMKNNHAVIMYDAKSRETRLLSGISQGMVYMGEKAVYEPIDLKSHNIIEMGNSKFIFIPLCGSDFDWADLDKDNN